MPSLVRPEWRAEAADVDRRVARVRRVELHGRNQFLQPVDVERSALRHQLTVDDGHRNRHFLRHFLHAPRRDDHSFGQPRRIQADVDDGAPGQPSTDRRANQCVESIERDLDPVAPGVEHRRPIPASGVGHRLDCRPEPSAHNANRRLLALPRRTNHEPRRRPWRAAADVCANTGAATASVAIKNKQANHLNSLLDVARLASRALAGVVVPGFSRAIWLRGQPNVSEESVEGYTIHVGLTSLTPAAYTRIRHAQRQPRQQQAGEARRQPLPGHRGEIERHRQRLRRVAQAVVARLVAQRRVNRRRRGRRRVAGTTISKGD